MITFDEFLGLASFLRSGLRVEYEDDGHDAGIVEARVDQESAVAGNGVLWNKVRQSTCGDPRLKQGRRLPDLPTF